MSENNNIDNERLEELRKSVRGKIKENKDDRELGVKPIRSNSFQKVKGEVNSQKRKKANTKAKPSSKSSNSKSKTKTSKNGGSTSKGKKISSSKSKSSKKSKKVSIILIVLTFVIVAAYSTFGRGYIEDMQREDFIKMVEPMAVDVYEEYGIYPSVVISRAAIESDWGKSGLSKEGFNLFGIKADKSWDGKTISMTTKEGYDDTEEAAFRKYRSFKESIYDYGKFLKENKRYEKAGLFKAKNAKEQAQILENAGYATKENSKGELVYADVLINVIDNYELEKIDRENIDK